MNCLRFSGVFSNLARIALGCRPSLLTCQRQVLFVSRQVYNVPNIKNQIQSDVKLFEYEKPKFFVIINGISALQLLFWSYMSYFLAFVLQSVELHSKSKFWNWLYTKESKYKTVLSSLALIFGITCTCATIFYTTRSVRSLTLHKGGRLLTLVTYKFPGFKSILKVPISEISSESARAKAKTFIPLKLKNKRFYYLVDLRGEFFNPFLFDSTAGVKRNF